MLNTILSYINLLKLITEITGVFLISAYPSAVRYVNRTITEHTEVMVPVEDVNPAPGK